MIERERPDIVHVVTQPADRAPLMHLVAELGVAAAVVEKPLAARVTDWRCAGGAGAAAAATRFTVSHQFRWHVDLTRCRAGRWSRGAWARCKLPGDLLRDEHLQSGYPRPQLHDVAQRRLAGKDGIRRRQRDERQRSDPPRARHLAWPTCCSRTACAACGTTGTTAPLIGDPDTTYQHVRVAAYAERGRVLYEEFRDWEIVSDPTESSAATSAIRGPPTTCWRRPRLTPCHAGLAGGPEPALPGTNLGQVAARVSRPCSRCTPARCSDGRSRWRRSSRTTTCSTQLTAALS